MSRILKQNNIDNPLEQDLEQVPSQTNQTQEEEKDLEQPMLYNAPQYSGSYDAGDYDLYGIPV